MAAPFSEDDTEPTTAETRSSRSLSNELLVNGVQTQSRRVGLLIGILLQCSLLGLYFGALFMNALDTTQMHCPLVLALVWSIALCFMGYVIFRTLRSLVVAVLEAQAISLLLLQQMDQRLDEEGQQPPPNPFLAPATTPLIQSTLQSALNGALVGVGVTSLLVSFGACALFQAKNEPDDATTTATSAAITFNDKPWLCGIVRDATLALLAAAIVWIAWTTLLSAWFGRHQPPCSDNDVTRPLLPIDNSTHVTTSVCDQQLQVEQERQALPVSGRRKMWHLQLSSLLFGSLVGWLIQCTSLSANLLVVHYHHKIMYPQHQQHDDDAPRSSRRWIMAVSLALSFVASCLGIALLLLVRTLLIRIVTCLVQTDPSSKSMAVLDLEPRSRLHEQSAAAVPLVNTLFHVECWLAVGTVLGLNVAWTITEYAMSMTETHWVQSGWILLGTTAWCQTVLFCCGYHKRSNATLSCSEVPNKSQEILSS